MAYRHAYSAVMRTLLRAAGMCLLLAAVLAAASGCNRGKADTKTESAQANGAPTGASALGYCSVTVTGAEQASNTVPAEEGDFDTDYWRTDAEMRGLIREMLREDEVNDVIPEDIDYLVEQAMARDPRLTLFVMDCSGEQAGITLVPGRYSRYADVPFRPNAYEIAPAVDIEAVSDGVFYVTAYTRRGGEPRHYAPVEPGTLNITAFNELQIAGTFTFAAAAADGQRIVMQGKFDYRKPKEEVFD